MLTRQSIHTPTYCLHKASGQGIVRLSGQVFYCGPFGDPKSKEKYWGYVREWLAQGRQLVERPEPGTGSGGPTVAQIMSPYLAYAEKYYRHKDGTPTGEYDNVRNAMRPLNLLYASLPAADFSPLKLLAVRQHMMDTEMCRGTINPHIGRIKRLFRWAVSQELVPGSVLHALDSVVGLRRGRSEAREAEPVKPVPTEHIDVIIGFLSPSLAKLKAIYEGRELQVGRPGPRLAGSADTELEQLAMNLPHESAVATMIELQRLTGMRPGEACIIRTGDLSMDTDVWVYRPRAHKTEHRGRAKEIAIGPRAQLILRPFLQTDLDAFVFSPARKESLRNQARRKARQTPMTPSAKARRRRQKSVSRSGERYTTVSYCRAIADACDRVYKLPDELAAAEREVGQWRNQVRRADGRRGLVTDMPEAIKQKYDMVEAYHAQMRWSPNQLRHTAATEIRKRYGTDAARTVLGHSERATTEIYAERDTSTAARIMGEVG